MTAMESAILSESFCTGDNARISFEQFPFMSLISWFSKSVQMKKCNRRPRAWPSAEPRFFFFFCFAANPGNFCPSARPGWPERAWSCLVLQPHELLKKKIAWNCDKAGLS